MQYSTHIMNCCPVAKGVHHENAPIPEEGKWVHAKEIKDISGLTHGVGACAPQQGACKLTLNIKDNPVLFISDISFYFLPKSRQSDVGALFAYPRKFSATPRRNAQPYRCWTRRRDSSTPK